MWHLYLSYPQATFIAAAPSSHTPSDLNTILTVGFNDDLKSLEATTYSFMNSHFKKCVYTMPWDQHILEIPLGLGGGGWAGLVAVPQERSTD